MRESVSHLGEFIYGGSSIHFSNIIYSSFLNIESVPNKFIIYRTRYYFCTYAVGIIAPDFKRFFFLATINLALPPRQCTVSSQQQKMLHQEISITFTMCSYIMHHNIQIPIEINLPNLLGVITNFLYHCMKIITLIN